MNQCNQQVQKSFPYLSTDRFPHNWAIADMVKGSRGFQKFNPIPGVKFSISLGFTEPTTHVIQAHYYIW